MYSSSEVDVTVGIGILTICPIFLEHGAPVIRYLEIRGKCITAETYQRIDLIPRSKFWSDKKLTNVT